MLLEVNFCKFLSSNTRYLATSSIPRITSFKVASHAVNKQEMNKLTKEAGSCLPTMQFDLIRHSQVRLSDAGSRFTKETSNQMWSTRTGADGLGATKQGRKKEERGGGGKKGAVGPRYLGSGRADERRRETAIESPPSLLLHHLRSTRSPPPTQAPKKKTQNNDGMRSAYTPTSSIWRTAPSPTADLDGSRSVCWRVFTCREPSTHERANPWWRSGGTYQEKRDEYGQQGVSDELSDDPAAGAGHAVDERVGHPLPFRPARSRVRARVRGELYREW